MLMFFMFHLIIYIAVNVQVLAGSEVTTLVFIVEFKYCNTSEFVSAIIWVKSFDIFMIFMGGYTN